MTRLLRAFVLLLAIAATLPACARDRDCAPRVREGWVRLLPGGMPMHAGFGRIENPCAMPLTITGARSAAYGSVELHESRVVEGMNRMRAVPELRIAPDDAAVLKPGGLHLMLMDPRAPLKDGSRVAIEFTLQDGRVLRGEFVARKPAL
ncbi:MAG TPA: copper chaperone PCu(A)C [Lysobacter sp.]|nr:copper chaperone PCu(A)C [Lysobacter sp.]